MSESTDRIRKAMEHQEREQVLFKARNTTPLQRIAWIEETRKLLANGFVGDTSRPTVAPESR